MGEIQPVTLKVKAPNNKIEDQVIQCESSWTVDKLKLHLSEVYPSKPVSTRRIRFHKHTQLICDFTTGQRRSKADLFRSAPLRLPCIEGCAEAV